MCGKAASGASVEDYAGQRLACTPVNYYIDKNQICPGPGNSKAPGSV